MRANILRRLRFMTLWVGRVNAVAPFNGMASLSDMLAGKVIDLADVRRYLAEWGSELYQNLTQNVCSGTCCRKAPPGDV
jgi:hypothetical protein